MKQKINGSITIRELRKQEGLSEMPEIVKEAPLSDWYFKISSQKIKELSFEDLARLIREEQHLGFIVPFVIPFLEKDPSIGDLYDFELLRSFLSINKEFWNVNRDIALSFLSLVKNLIKTDYVSSYDWVDEEDKNEFIELLQNLQIQIN